MHFSSLKVAGYWKGVWLGGLLQNVASRQNSYRLAFFDMKNAAKAYMVKQLGSSYLVRVP